MVKLTRILLALAVCYVSQVAAAEKSLNIGVVDWQQAVSKAPQAAAIEAQMRNEFIPKQEDLVAMSKDLQEKAEKLKRDKPILKEDEIISRTREINALNDTLNRKKKELEEDVERSRQAGLKTVLEKVNEAIKTVAKEKGFDIILTSETVPYISDRVDITQQVVARLSDPLAK